MVGVNQPALVDSMCEPLLNGNPNVEHESPGSEELNNEAQDSRHLVSDDERVDRVRKQMERRVKIFCIAAKNGGFTGAPLESTVDTGRHGESDLERLFSLETELKAKTRDNESLQARLFEFERERVELSEEKDMLKEQLMSKSERVADLEARVGALVRERERSKAGLAPPLVASNADTESRLKAAEIQCRRLKEERETTTTQNRIMRNQVDAYITSLKKSDDANKALQEKLNAADAELADLKDVVKELDVARDSSMQSAALRALSGQAATREMKNSSLIRSADFLDSVHRELRREVVDLQSRLAAAGMEMMSLRDLNARLDGENLARLEKENAYLKLALQKSENALACREKDLQALEGAHRSVQSLLRASKKMHVAAAERVRDLQEVEAKNAELQSALEEAGRTEDELQVLKGVHRSMLSVMNASKVSQARMIHTEKELRAGFEALQEEVRTAQSELALRQDEVESLGAALDAAHTEVEVLKGISQVDKSLINASSNQMANLAAQTGDLDAMLSNATRKASEENELVVAENRKLVVELAKAKSQKGLTNIDLVALAVGGLVATLLFAFLIRM